MDSIEEKCRTRGDHEIFRYRQKNRSLLKCLRMIEVAKGRVHFYLIIRILLKNEPL